MNMDLKMNQKQKVDFKTEDLPLYLVVMLYGKYESLIYCVHCCTFVPVLAHRRISKEKLRSQNYALLDLQQ